MGVVPRWLMDWFWLLGAAIMLVNAGVVYLRAGPLVRSRRVSDAERRRFALGLGSWTAGFCVAVQAVAWRWSESRPECLAEFPPRTPASMATTALTLLAWALLLAWVWRGSGAEKLARFAPVLVPARPGRAPAHPDRVRRTVGWLVALAIAASLVASRLAPAPADCGSWGSAGAGGP